MTRKVLCPSSLVCYFSLNVHQSYYLSFILVIRMTPIIHLCFLLFHRLRLPLVSEKVFFLNIKILTFHIIDFNTWFNYSDCHLVYQDYTFNHLSLYIVTIYNLLWQYSFIFSFFFVFCFYSQYVLLFQNVRTLTLRFYILLLFTLSSLDTSLSPVLNELRPFFIVPGLSSLLLLLFIL